MHVVCVCVCVCEEGGNLPSSQVQKEMTEEKQNIAAGAVVPNEIVGGKYATVESTRNIFFIRKHYYVQIIMELLLILREETNGFRNQKYSK